SLPNIPEITLCPGACPPDKPTLILKAEAGSFDSLGYNTAEAVQGKLSLDVSSEAKSRPLAITILYRVLNNLAGSLETLCVTQQEIANISELLTKKGKGEDLRGLLTTLRPFISLIPKENFKNSPDLQISPCKEMMERTRFEKRTFLRQRVKQL
ncbi:hypothetical protein Tco_1012493, partial [Tanacetum coccineum]